MNQSTILRILGIVILIALLLLVIVLHLVGAVNLIQSATELLLIFISIVGTVAFQLVIWPQRFLPRPAVAPQQVEREPTSVESSRPVASNIEAKHEAQIPSQFEIANCLNCGGKWPVPPLSQLGKNILTVGDLFYEKDLPRTVTCPKCGMPAPVTAQPKTMSQVLPKRETLQRGLNELSVLNEAQGYYPAAIPTLSISNLVKLDHQKVLEICRDLGARELLEVKEMNGHALVRITSRGQKALREAG